MNQYRHEPWTKEGPIAVRLSGESDGLESALTRAWPVERETPFSALLRAIDQAERGRGGDARSFA